MKPKANGRSDRSDRRSLPFKQFVWGAGIECSFLPHLNVDQFEWTQHDRFWRDDLKRAARRAGHHAPALRASLAQARTERGKFDWTIADERIDEMQKLGIEPLMDVMHFGTPLWLKQAVGDPEFPEALERFTDGAGRRAIAARIKTWCPFNEPLVSALFSGDFGFWPPHSRKWRGYMPVLSDRAGGEPRHSRDPPRDAGGDGPALRRRRELTRRATQELEVEVQRRNLRRFLVMDLLLGRVDQHHPLYPWLTSYGMSELDIEWFRTNPQTPDVLGLDYYPHSDWQLDRYGGACASAARIIPSGSTASPTPTGSATASR